MFKKIIDAIIEFDQIIILRHLRPDGDCIGSQMGLKAIIENSFPNKKVYAVGDQIPDYLSFLGENDLVEDHVFNDSLVIVVDTSIEDRICDSRWKLAKKVIKIDHHDDSNDYGDLIYVDPLLPACALIICQLVNSSPVLKMNQKAAYALFTSIVTDTGRFQYRGISQETMELSGQLLDYGIDYEQIYAYLYTKKIESFLLQGYVYNHVKFTENKVAYLHFTSKIMEKYQVSCEDAAAQVNLLSGIYDSMIWVTFVDYPENTRVRIRSRKIPINDIAQLYRGGGHLVASGATVYNHKEKKEILRLLDQRLSEYRQNHPEEH